MIQRQFCLYYMVYSPAGYVKVVGSVHTEWRRIVLTIILFHGKSMHFCMISDIGGGSSPNIILQLAPAVFFFASQENNLAS
jgi:hypothetical protein